MAMPCGELSRKKPDLVIPEVEAIATDTLAALEAESGDYCYTHGEGGSIDDES